MNVMIGINRGKRISVNKLITEWSQGLRSQRQGINRFTMQDNSELTAMVMVMKVIMVVIRKNDSDR